LVAHLPFESAAAVDLAGAVQRGDGVDAGHAADAFSVARDDLVRALREPGDSEEEDSDSEQHSAHAGFSFSMRDDVLADDTPGAARGCRTVTFRVHTNPCTMRR